MAVVASNDAGWIVSHELLINDIYKKTVHSEETKCFKINPALFDIQIPFVKSRNAGEDLKEGDIEEVKVVKKAYRTLSYAFASNEVKSEQLNNFSAKSVAKSFYELSNDDSGNKFRGGNNSMQALVNNMGKVSFLFPTNCKFYCYDVKYIRNYLKNEKYDFILMDPPWWNKYVRRKKKKNFKYGYEMMFDKDLAFIPIHSLLEKDGIIAIWCTNAHSHINAILNELFPAWNVKFVSQWFWLKVTKFGQPICDFSSTSKKQPFERIIFGARKDSDRYLPNPEENKVIISIPSAIHSHKPPLSQVISTYLPEKPKCLELFARYLLPEWTSYGNEVLKLQNKSLYHESIS